MAQPSQNKSRISIWDFAASGPGGGSANASPYVTLPFERPDPLSVHAEQPVAANPLTAFIKFAPAATYRTDIGTDQPADPISQ
jgi:hypothetical protein